MPSHKLNLGCGAFKLLGFINIDNSKFVEPDVLHNLNHFPYPFQDDWFSKIVANHSLEHLDDVFSVMGELHRILRPEGELIIRVPHFSRGFTHADHKRGFDITFPYYFDPTFPGGYTGVHFELTSMKLRWYAQPRLKRALLGRFTNSLLTGIGAIVDIFANLSPPACSRIWCYWVGGFEELEMRFQKPDPIAKKPN